MTKLVAFTIMGLLCLLHNEYLLHGRETPFIINTSYGVVSDVLIITNYLSKSGKVFVDYQSRWNDFVLFHFVQ